MKTVSQPSIEAPGRATLHPLPRPSFTANHPLSFSFFILSMSLLEAIQLSGSKFGKWSCLLRTMLCELNLLSTPCPLPFTSSAAQSASRCLGQRAQRQVCVERNLISQPIKNVTQCVWWICIWLPTAAALRVSRTATCQLNCLPCLQSTCAFEKRLRQLTSIWFMRETKRQRAPERERERERIK